MSKKESKQGKEVSRKYVSKAGIGVSPSRAGTHNAMMCGKVRSKKQRAAAEQMNSESKGD